MNALADIAKKYLGQETVMITANNSKQAKLDCGSLPARAVITLNFGSNEHLRPHFTLARTTMGGSGPYVTFEYWTDYGSPGGVIPQWGYAFPRRTGEEIATWLDRQLQLGASVNMYMYYGRSNWVYAGAAGSTEFGGSYKPCLTSYDYDAPLTEAGDLTDKFVKIRDVIAKYQSIPAISVRNSTKRSYGPVLFTQSVRLAAAPEVISKVVESSMPKTMEIWTVYMVLSSMR
jgi:hypothetical protein